MLKYIDEITKTLECNLKDATWLQRGRVWRLTLRVKLASRYLWHIHIKRIYWMQKSPSCVWANKSWNHPRRCNTSHLFAICALLIEKSCSHVTTLTGDIRSTDKVCSRYFHNWFVVPPRDCFNLAVKDPIEDKNRIVKKISCTHAEAFIFYPRNNALYALSACYLLCKPCQMQMRISNAQTFSLSQTCTGKNQACRCSRGLTERQRLGCSGRSIQVSDRPRFRT